MMLPALRMPWSEFELAIDPKTAKALGLTMPDAATAGRSGHTVDRPRAPMRIAGWFLVGLVLLSAGCATPGPPHPATVDVTGTWAGTWSCPQCPPPQGVGAITMRLDQVGAAVTGSISWGTLRAGSRVEGNVSRNVLLFRAPDIDLTGELSVRGNDMEGKGRAAGLSISMSLHRY